MAYTALTNANKQVTNPSGIFPSGEANYFDAAVQDIHTGTTALTNENTFVDQTDGPLQTSTFLHPGFANNDDDSTVANSLVKPTGLAFKEIVDSKGTSYLSNAQDFSPPEAFTTLINPYIHYMPNPNGGAGLIDLTEFYYGYNPSTDSNTSSYFRYGQP